MSTVSETLNTAADLIQEYGWQRGFGWPSRGRTDKRLCLEGGVMAAMGLDYYDVDLSEFWACPAYRAVQSYLGLSHERSFHKPTDSIASPVDPLWRFNDDRTAAEVIEVLRAAAVIEAARENESAAVEVTA